MSTWDTEAHARFARGALGDAVRRIEAAGARLDPPEIYEVAVER